MHKKKETPIANLMIIILIVLGSIVCILRILGFIDPDISYPTLGIIGFFIFVASGYKHFFERFL